MKSWKFRDLAPLVVLVLIFAIACSNPERAQMTFVNTTVVDVCFHPSSVTGLSGRIAESEDLTALGRLCDEIKPQAVSRRDTGCGYGENSRNRRVTVSLTEGLKGQTIYEKTASCFEWQDANATFIIKQIDGEFVVTDSLPD